MGYMFVESVFWESLPAINYGLSKLSGTALGGKLYQKSSNLLNRLYYDTSYESDLNDNESYEKDILDDYIII